MKFLPYFLFFLFPSFCFGQSVNQWHHFYTHQTPIDMSLSDNQFTMIKGKGLLRYDLDSQEFEHFNITTHPNMPTNKWKRVLESPINSDLWAVPNGQFANLNPLYRYDGTSWEGYSLGEMFSAVFSYSSMEITKGGNLLIPGVKDEVRIVAILQDDETWKIVEVTPHLIKEIIGTSGENFFVLTSYNLLAYNADTEEIIEIDDTWQNKDIFATGDASKRGVFALTGENRIFYYEAGMEAEEYLSEERPFFNPVVVGKKLSAQDVNGYMWMAGKYSLLRFKTGETIQTFDFPADGLINDRWETLRTDKNGNAWLTKRGMTQQRKLWKCTPETGLQSFEIEGAIENTPIPIGYLPDEDFYFRVGNELKTINQGIFEDDDFVGMEEGTGLPWIAEGEDGTSYSGKIDLLEYKRKENDGSEAEILPFVDENDEPIDSLQIISVSERGDLLAFRPFTSDNTLEGRIHHIKQHDKNYWEKYETPYDIDFYGKHYLIFGMSDTIVRFNFRTGESNNIENTPEMIYISDVKKDLNGKMWFIASSGPDSYLGYMEDDYPVFFESDELGLDVQFSTITPDNKGNVWVNTFNHSGVFLWDGETVLKHIHHANSGLQFSPTFIYSDHLENLWMCYRKECTVYNENGVNFNYEELQLNFIKTNDSDFNIAYLPNPVTNVLSICTDIDMTEIKIYDALGKLVFAEEVEATKIRNITVSDMAAGIYFCSVNSGEKQKTFKFIKQ
ncbi:MAG: hypothetical protein ACI85O_003801 [Saprospiraceae bacterium]|jgi:hypothetical protein